LRLVLARWELGKTRRLALKINDHELSALTHYILNCVKMFSDIVKTYYIPGHSRSRTSLYRLGISHDECMYIGPMYSLTISIVEMNTCIDIPHLRLAIDM